jgi:GT2 family glycosyltransferase
VDTVFGGAYRREVFEQVGLFNEQLVRGQDLEFNLRLKRAGKRTLLVPSIVSYYYARATLGSFWKHNWTNGIWAVKPFQFSHGFPVSWRHLAPLALTISLLGSAALGAAWHPAWWGFLAISATYAVVMLTAAIQIGFRQKDPRFLALMPIVFLALHVPYGLGSIAGSAQLFAARLALRRAVRAPRKTPGRLIRRLPAPEQLPRVSIIIPCRREARHIRGVLEAVLRTTYPMDRLEILLVDGMSNDGTREVITKIAETHQSIRLLDNPKKIIPAALNIGILQASGEIVVRMDAHTIYPPDYVEQCVRGLQQTGADSVGGATTVIPTDPTIVGRAIALALSHRFGVGNALHRLAPVEPTETDTVPFGSFWRSRLIDLGLYDERFARSEDMEFNARLRAAGGRIVLLPEIKSFYYARSGLREFARHSLSNGFWALFPIAFGPLPMRPRHVIPLCFVLGLVLPAAGSLWWPHFSLVSMTLAGAYLTANLWVSAAQAIRNRSWGLMLVLPLVFAALHVLYGLGSAVGLARGLWRRFTGPRIVRQPA